MKKKLLILFIFGFFYLPQAVGAELKLHFWSQSAGSAIETKYQFDLADDRVRGRLFFLFIERVVVREQGNPLVGFELVCSGEERRVISSDEAFQQALFAVLGSHASSIQVLGLSNLGSEWVVNRLGALPNRLVRQLRELQLPGLRLDPDNSTVINRFNKFLRLLDSVDCLNLNASGLNDFRSLAQLLVERSETLNVVSLMANKFGSDARRVVEALNLCTQLSRLNCADCGLDVFPVRPGCGRRLKWLCLGDNDFSRCSDNDLSKVFAGLELLEELHLENCRLSSLGFLALPAARCLKRLYASDNDLSGCGVEELKQLVMGLSGLEKLVLGNCKLKDPAFLLAVPRAEQVEISFYGENFQGGGENFLRSVMRDSTAERPEGDGRSRFKDIQGVPMVSVDAKKLVGAVYDPVYLSLLLEELLEELDLSGSNFWGLKDELRRELSRFKGLKSLSLRNCWLSDEDLFCIVHASKGTLELLDVSGSNFFTDGYILRMLPELEVLKSLRADNINEATGEAIFSKLDGSLLERLADIPVMQREKVAELRLSHCDFTQQGWSWNDLARILKNFPALKRLRITQSMVRGDGFEQPGSDLQELFAKLELFDLSEVEFVRGRPNLQAIVGLMRTIRQLRFLLCGFTPNDLEGAIHRLATNAGLLRVLDVTVEEPVAAASLLNVLAVRCSSLESFDAGCLKFSCRKGVLTILGYNGDLYALLEQLSEPLRGGITQLSLPQRVGLPEELETSHLMHLQLITARALAGDGYVHKSIQRGVPEGAGDSVAEGSRPVRTSRKAAQLVTPEVREAGSASSQISSDDEVDDESLSAADSDDEDHLDDLIPWFAQWSLAALPGSERAMPARRVSARPGAERIVDFGVAGGSVGQAAQGRRQIEPVSTEIMYRYKHPGYGAICLKARPWAASMSSKNYDIRGIESAEIIRHCRSVVGVAPRVSKNFAESYTEGNKRDDLEHAFDIGAIVWILQHGNTQAFRFKRENIAFVLPVSLSWIGDEGQICMCDRFAVCTFDRSGRLHHACMHKTISNNGRYELLQRGMLSVGCNDSGLVFKLNA